ncbi:hypothetical protein D3C87_1785260 [compost metagenome]
MRNAQAWMSPYAILVTVRVSLSLSRLVTYSASAVMAHARWMRNLFHSAKAPV